MKTLKWWAAASVAVAIAAVVSLPATEPALGGSPPIKVVAKDFLFSPKVITGTTGTVQFVVTNNGTIEHSFVSDELKVKSGLIKPGKTVTITAAAKPGTYKFYCDIPGHKEIGMVATFTVR